MVEYLRLSKNTEIGRSPRVIMNIKECKFTAVVDSMANIIQLVLLESCVWIVGAGA